MGNKDKFDQKYKSHQQASSKLVIHPFIVPIIEENGELKLNWKLIEQIIKYIRDKIHEVLYIQKSRETIYQSLNLDPVKEKTSNFQNSQFAQK
jgi:CRISPR/Cas system-associated protein Cas7 (RAMP superfamily)